MNNNFKLFRYLKTFETLTVDTDQPLAQTVSCHNELQPMTTQQRAAMAQAALINFFGEAGTVSSIMNTVQPSHTQTSTECSDNSQLNISETQSGMSLPVSTHSYCYICWVGSVEYTPLVTRFLPFGDIELKAQMFIYNTLF